MQRTLVILKPDAVNRGLVGEITKVFEANHLRLVALKMQVLGREVWEDHYKHHADKPFFKDTVEFMAAGPVICMVWQGGDAVSEVRRFVGATNPLEADAGTIRADHAKITGRNLIHASDSEETANEEIKRFFKDEEVYDWQDMEIALLSGENS